jgi:branched-chain amino acid transport system permease protein
VEYLLHIVVLASIYIVLAASLDLLAGHVGLLSLSQSALFGLGAYISALFSVHYGVSFPVGASAGIAATALVSLGVSVAFLRLRDDYFVLATFGFQMIVFTIFNNWVQVTHGPLGISGIPSPDIFGGTVNSHVGFAILAVGLAALAYALLMRIATGPFGRVLHAIREDEIFLATLGKNPLGFKIAAFAISGACSGLAGSLYAHYMNYIDPSSFTVTDSILILSMVIVGGAGSRWGPLVGALMLVLLPEALRFIGLPSAAAANLRLIIYGALLVLIVMLRPWGLVGRYGFGR